MASVSPTKRLGHCPLVVPSSETPWSVDVVSAIPKDVMQSQASGGSLRTNYVVGSSRAACWYCLGTVDPNASGSGGFYVWHVPPNTSLENQKNRLPVSKLIHPKIRVDTATAPLLAMEVSPTTPDILYLYAAQPTSGAVVLWKLTPNDLNDPRKLLAPPAKCTLIVDLLPNETITSLSVEWKPKHASPMIVVGTDKGRIIWVVQTHVPIALHAQVADPAASGLLTRLLKKVQYHETTPIVTTLCCAEKEFLSVSKSGKIVQWKVSPTEAHKAYFDATERCNLLEMLRERLNQEAPSLYSLEVQCAAMPLDASAVHVLALTTHVNDESRLYWVRLDGVGGTTAGALDLQQVVWLNRFVAPASVKVAGWLVADNGVGYGAFVQDVSLPAIVMALEPSSAGQVVEVDLPLEQIQSVLANTLAKDVVTHGCSILTESGMGLRVRLISNQPEGSSNFTGSSNSSAAKTLSHLRSTFWEHYQHPDQPVRLPPSLTTASSSDLEQPILAFALELKKKGDISSTQNPTEWHVAFISLLQQAGFYRSLSTYCKWALLGIGQELFVFWWLGTSSSETSAWGADQRGQLKPHAIADWLERTQKAVLAEGGGEDRQEEWIQWLCTALVNAELFREEQASYTYDVSSDKTPQACGGQHTPVWTSCPALQRVLRRQLSYWMANPATAGADCVEVVVKAALQSFGDSYASDPSPARHEAYTLALKHAIPFLRKTTGKANDQLAFALAKTYKYYGGLCQIALDHEKMPDKHEFTLDQLFSELSKYPDTDTGMVFADFVLKWHTDRELFGHVLNYGKHCPQTLNHFLQNEQALRPFRWIHSIRHGDYSGATDSLINNAEISEVKLFDAKFVLSMAVMAEKESGSRQDIIPSARRQRIDKKLELVNAQEDLFGSDSPEPLLWGASNLLDHALSQLKNATNTADRIQACFIGLAICNSFESREESHEHAANVWWNALMADSGMWSQWLHSETNLTDKDLANEILQRTVFGGLFQQTETEESWRDVVYGPILEDRVIEMMAQHDASAAGGMRRLLRSLTTGKR